jgi:molybdate-binding protein/DNA-binding XRE family transcriptional regulator
MEVRTNLTRLRTQRGIAAARLAGLVGISRQTVYAIEAGTYVPNTAVSLKLARVLDTTVEELFQLEAESAPVEEILEATVIAELDTLDAGQLMRVCRVGKSVVAVPAESSDLGLPSADGALLDPVRKARGLPTARVRVVNDKWRTTLRLLIAGCDPSVSILAQSLQAQGCELLVAYGNSSRALELLHADLAHVAGTHLVDSGAEASDLRPITSMFGRNSLAVIAYAVWEEGVLTAQGNPKRIAGVADLAREDVRFTNREPGAGCRRLLDDLLGKHRLTPKHINGYDRITLGHLPAARLVRSGEVDCCISTRAVARTLALDFIPLAKKPYHLVLRRSRLNEPPVQILVETLGRSSFRREVESCTGYNMRTAGNRIL